VSSPLLAKDGEKLKKLVLDASCTPLVVALCGRSADIKAAVASMLATPTMLAAVATPETASIALKLIETCGLEITDGVSELKAAVTSPAMISAVATPETAGVALKLIETYGIEISDEVRELA
jgi:uncharacterized membrane protein (DUF2068 family)